MLVFFAFSLPFILYLQPSFHYKQGHPKITAIHSNICFGGLVLTLYSQSFNREILKLKRILSSPEAFPTYFHRAKSLLW